MLKVLEHVRSTHNHDGAVVLDVRHGQMYRLNFVGSRMLELLKQAYTEEQIADEISRAFRVARETVVSDLQEFLTHLEKHRLLETRQAENLSKI